MLSKELIDLIFKAFSIERWNDKLRPLPLIQMDKHAHKMGIAWVIAKFEEDKGVDFSWIDIIKGGIYELLKRNVISDIQSPVYKEITKNKKLLEKLNYMIFKEVEGKIEDRNIKNEFESYLLDENSIHPHSFRILEAAHRYSSYWEFQIVKNANPNGYNIPEIEILLGNELEKFKDLDGILKLKQKHSIKNFIDLFGELRYQIRWGHIPRIPQTSVLGHSMLVSILSYFFSLKLNKPCNKRIYNNFFTGIFHDLPEVVTRDIITPVKRSVPGMVEEIHRIERELAERDIYPHIKNSWIPEIKYFTQDEFNYKTNQDKSLEWSNFNANFNFDKYSPVDGPLIKVADDFSAFIEAYKSVNYGISTIDLVNAMESCRYKYKDKTVSGLPVYQLFNRY